MVDRLLALKKPISEYFWHHPQNAPKLTSHEWTVTNEVCSLLDDVSEATIRMQRAGDTHVNQTMFSMTEVIAMLKEESHPIWVPNAIVLPPSPDGIPTESTQVVELTLEAQDVLEVLLEVKEDKGVGRSEAKGAWRRPARERLCGLQDPYRRRLEGGDCRVCGCTDAAVRTCAGASVGRGVRGTCTLEEVAFETRGTARGTCESGSRWGW